MPNPQDISDQQRHLRNYRQNAQILLDQIASQGGFRVAPLKLLNNLREARNEIVKRKTILRDWGIYVDDLSCDFQEDDWSALASYGYLVSKRLRRLNVLYFVFILVLFAFLGYLIGNYGVINKNNTDMGGVVKSSIPSHPENNPSSAVRTGVCSSLSSNHEDDVDVRLDENTWYAIQSWDKAASPKIFRFLVRFGSTIVRSSAKQGSRAWKCPDQKTAQQSSMRSAINFKLQHQEYIVYGPDGNEVK